MEGDKIGIFLIVEIGGLIVRRYVEGNNIIEREILMMKEKRIDGVMFFMRWEGVGFSEEMEEVYLGRRWAINLL